MALEEAKGESINHTVLFAKPKKKKRKEVEDDIQIVCLPTCQQLDAAQYARQNICWKSSINLHLALPLKRALY